MLLARRDRAVAPAGRQARRRHYVGSILFRDDELALCLFDAAPSAAVRQTAEAAGIPCERVMDALWLPSPHQELTAP